MNWKIPERVFFWSSVLVILFFASIILIRGTVVSTFLLTLSIHIFLTLGAIRLIKRFRLNKNLIISCVLLGLSLLSIEIYLRYFRGDVYKTYMELNGSPWYVSRYKIHNWNTRYIPTNKPHSKIQTNKTEYDYTASYNNLGLRNQRDITASKQNNEYRILALGDSFTEGIGAPDDSTWVQLLETKLNQKTPYSNIQVINAGKSGNDPIYNLHFLQNELASYEFDQVLLAINDSDVLDITSRGGMNRYNEQGKLKLKKGPPWELAYGISFIVRDFIHDLQHYEKSLIRSDQVGELYQQTINDLYTCIMEFDEYCSKKNIDFKLIFIPNESEMRKGYLAHNMDGLYARLEAEKKVDIVYLPTCYLNVLRMTNTSIVEYYWASDFHHNGRGYEMLADCLAVKLMP